MNVGERVHWVIIVVKTRMGGQTLWWKKWENLPWNTRTKFDWYFKYRAALAQVNNPRAEVEFRWGHEPATGNTLEIAYKNKLKGKRATITKFENAIKEAESTWDQLFPITDDIRYINKKRKLERLHMEYNELLASDPTSPELFCKKLQS